MFHWVQTLGCLALAPFDAVPLPARDFAQITINNGLTEAIDIRFTIGPEQHFTPIVRKETGEVVSSAQNFGITASVASPERLLTINRNASHRIDLWYPLETVPAERLVAGKYFVRVQFHYKAKVWESNEIEITHK